MTVYRKPYKNLPLIALWLLVIPAYFVAGATAAVVLAGLGLAVPAVRHEDYPDEG